MNPYIYPTVALATGTIIATIATLLIFSNIQNTSIRKKAATLIIAATTVTTIGALRLTEILPGPLAITSPADDNRIYTLYANTNNRYTAGLQHIDVKEHSILFTISGFRNKFKTIGLYQTDAKRILLKQADMNSFNWAHEVAHHVWYHKLTEQERTEWTTNYDAEKTAYENNRTGFFLSEYSLTKVQEDYADAFATYALSPYEVPGWRKTQLEQQSTRIANCTECFWIR